MYHIFQSILYGSFYRGCFVCIIIIEIIDECLDQKIYDTAINAIKELNKMTGVVQQPQNQVTIAKNQQGEEMINITFDS